MRHPFYKRPLQSINDNLYQIHAEYPIDRVKDVQGVKEWLRCDVAFKSNQNGTYIFCKRIEEAIILG